MSLGQDAELQQRINQFWNERAASAQGAAHHAIVDDNQRRAWLGALAPLLPPAPADVLDVGTGTGFLAFLLSDLGHRVTGIDLSDGMLSSGGTAG
jgi:ubiquinone/menaquinone biosynthesis C-methylase UbiE